MLLSLSWRFSTNNSKEFIVSLSYWVYNHRLLKGPLGYKYYPGTIGTLPDLPSCYCHAWSK